MKDCSIGNTKDGPQNRLSIESAPELCASPIPTGTDQQNDRFPWLEFLLGFALGGFVTTAALLIFASFY